MDRKYCLLVKTGQSEIKAIKNIQHKKDGLLPIIELTRGRKTKLDPDRKIERNIDILTTVFQNNDIILDLTASTELSNIQIDELYNFKDGYIHWNDFINKLGVENKFRSITPVLLQNFDDPDYEGNFILQTKNFIKNFESFAYRSNIAEDGCYIDIGLIKDLINSNAKKFYFIIDCEFINPASWQSYSKKIIERIQRIKKEIPKIYFVIIGTSFPKTVTEFGDEHADTFALNEVNIFKEVEKIYEDNNLLYGDYGCINPIRNDNIRMTHGWIPRIDVPLENSVYYNRLRKEYEGQEYVNVYTKLAKLLTVKNKAYPSHLTNNWGIQQINTCLSGIAPGASPGFWISVRMSIHIEQQLRRLKLL